MAERASETTGFTCHHCGAPIDLNAVPQHDCFLGRTVYSKGKVLFVTNDEPIAEDFSCGEKDKKQKAEWNKQNTMALISLYEANSHLIDHPKKKTKIWSAISEGLHEQHSIQATADQVRWKMNSLLTKYRACADNNAKSGRVLQTLEYYDRLEEFMGQERIASATYTKSSNVPSKTTAKSKSTASRTTTPPGNEENLPPGTPSLRKRVNDDNARQSTSTGGERPPVPEKKSRPGHGSGSKLAKGKLELENQWLGYILGASSREAERNKRYEKNLKIQQEKMDMKRALADKRLKSKEKRNKEILEIERQKLDLLKKFFNKRGKKGDSSSDLESDWEKLIVR